MASRICWPVQSVLVLRIHSRRRRLLVVVYSRSLVMALSRSTSAVFSVGSLGVVGSAHP